MPVKTDPVALLREQIAPARHRLEVHPLYREIHTIRQLRLFMESHVFAVWDFMSLLKALQGAVTCVATPWVPSLYPESRRLVNDIVLGEESDTFRDGYVSHFELYLDSMAQAGADTGSIQRILADLRQGSDLDAALARSGAPAEAVDFVRTTFAFIDTGKPHVIAAAFTFGREDLIPTMFHQMVKDLRQNFETVQLFEYYLDRHIEVDSDSHGPMALRMMEELCGSDDQKWDEAGTAAVAALEARVALWDGILQRVQRPG